VGINSIQKTNDLPDLSGRSSQLSYRPTGVVGINSIQKTNDLPDLSGRSSQLSYRPTVLEGRRALAVTQKELRTEH